MRYFVYQITNLLNGKIYVGAHKGEPDDGYMGSGNMIMRAIRKHGVDNFRKDILLECETQEQMYLEEARIVTKEFIKREDTYNLTLGGYGSFDHINSNPEARKHASTKALNTFLSKPKEELERIYRSRALNGSRNFWFGKDRSGENNPRFGVKLDEDLKSRVKAGQRKAIEEGRWNFKGPGDMSKEGRESIAKANSREFKFINPEGYVVAIVNLAKFCKENGLNEGSMRHVSKGRYIQHKGWRKA